MGDKSSFDVFVSIWGENLEKCSLACKQEILKEVNRITTVGGCYESEEFFRVTPRPFTRSASSITHPL